MAEATLLIFGEIGIDVTTESILAQLKIQSLQDGDDEEEDIDTINLIINSPGGFVNEGFAILNTIISQGKKIKAECIGMCASMATPFFFSANFEDRIMHPNSRLMMHNPLGGAFGDADDLQKGADDLRQLEDEFKAFYATHTKLTPEQIDEFMEEERFISRDEAIELGLVPDILPIELQAVAKLKSYTTMSDIKKENETTKSLLDTIKALAAKLVPQANAEPVVAPAAAPEPVVEPEPVPPAKPVVEPVVETPEPTLTAEQQEEFDKLKALLEAKDKELEELKGVPEAVATLTKKLEELENFTQPEPAQAKTNHATAPVAKDTGLDAWARATDSLKWFYER